MRLATRVLALASRADDFREAGLVFVVLDLVSRHCDLIATIACYWFMRANFTVLFFLADMVSDAAVIRAFNEGFLTSLLHVLLELAERDLSLSAAIRAPEHGLVQNGCHDGVKITLLSKLVITRIARVSAFWVLRRFLVSAIDAGQPPA